MRNINDWVYNGEGGIDDNFKKNNGLWTETNSQTYWDQLECVPPIRMKGNAFMVGEPYTFNVYAAFVNIGDRYFGANRNIKTFDPGVYRQEIRKQFSIED